MFHATKQRLAAVAAAAALAATAASFAAPATAAGAAARGELTYGSDILLQNQYGGDGGYLDTNGRSGQQGAKYDVSTSHYSDRGTGTGSWKVLPAS